MNIKKLSLGHIQANCYILNGGNGDGAVIDPGDFNKELLVAIQESGIKNLKYIICTHGHFDHISGVGRLKEKYPQAQVVVGAGDSYFLDSELFSACAYFGLEFFPCHCDKSLVDGEILNIGDTGLSVISAPGHSPGGIILYSENEKIAFTGDTLFKGSIGRTDLHGGSHPQIMKSVKIIKSFSPDTVLYPGHGESTTVAHECMYNFYLL